MKIYLITDQQLENIEKQHDALTKTQNMCDLMLDIAQHSENGKTFDAAIELATGELDRLERYFDSCEVVLAP
ncbi:hypothetical protein PL263_03170 [Methylomonas sp. EFPC3]|uniref:hypothetical protein n=1 Tax=Methylomonas TaxID=416 RepID=UPI001126285C|nr:MULTISPECIES: hypothetical protein [Methylomonas]TPQ26542.1 hypothetical protein C2U68_11780 [Methylomonas koyamae]WFP51037.1 hypothetical protein PL263_03170 [Methylomonas sp. EFPC3]